MKVLVTGGAGYIGSHTVVELLQAGHDVVVVDSLVNGHAEAIERVQDLTGRPVDLEVGDIRDRPFLDRVFAAHTPSAVVHFAGLKAVGESVENPLAYYDVSVGGSRVLLEAMDAAGCHKIIFSSSATVYGEPQYLPYDEQHPTNPVNPYGRTKMMVEQILGDWCAADPACRAISLRYFNPVGAHPSGRIGEDPQGIPNNLMPYIAQVAVGQRPALQIFEDDYEARDGTGERDYVHVVDLAKAHVAAIEALEKHAGHQVVNVGRGQGVTVLELVAAFEQASDTDIARLIAPRRAGDLPSFYANASQAKALVGWQAELGIAEMCRDTWNWQCRNPAGFGASQ
ncbi:UDP-glucose 4-epimerase (plasmid) [Sulfitobacter indolifex]|uniref:UDP-glucose 4-epimerase GalE n=1 Tax=Sulfitobacter indolifex TaxID=225422 RepID=UPI001FACB05F|nr:UDP-glucose 4-epimerase GalE [Sulfitobacter indolifex]UOA20699.1 UDP-glucose 4-epimerase [Sulfitobacter indolifex]